MTSIIVFIILVGLYFLPAIIAFVQDRLNWPAILILNLLLGWTLVGWVVALVWAVTADPAWKVKASKK